MWVNKIIEMKHKNNTSQISYLIGILILSIMISCDSNIVFDNAMPQNAQELSLIPDEFQGIYICEGDSSIFYAHHNSVLIDTYFQFFTTLDQVKETENCSIADHGIFLPGKNECVPFEYVSEDTISFKVNITDTLFAFRSFEKLKLYKGRLFFNLQDKQGHWTTFMVSPMDGGALSLLMVDLSKDLEALQELEYKKLLDQRIGIENKKQYLIKPNLIEFDLLIDRELTPICESLTPIKYTY